MQPTRDEIFQFSELIESLKLQMKLGYMDTILYHCEKTGLEIDVASTLINSAIKSKIREEAESLNLMRRNNKLPI